MLRHLSPPGPIEGQAQKATEAINTCLRREITKPHRPFLKTALGYRFTLQVNNVAMAGILSYAAHP